MLAMTGSRAISAPMSKRAAKLRLMMRTRRCTQRSYRTKGRALPRKPSIMRLHSAIHVLLAVAVGISAIRSASAATDATAPATQLATLLAANRFALSMEGDAVRGPGAELLLKNAREAQFVLVGEDHGFAEVPRLTETLYRALARTGTRSLVLEIGPISAGRAERALRAKKPDGLARLNAEYPFALPFLSWREDGELAAAAIGLSSSPTLVGVDQEFILSPRMHFARLAELAPNEASRRLAEDYAQRDRSAYKTILSEHDPAKSLLPLLGEKDFAQLRAVFTRIPGTPAPPGGKEYEKYPAKMTSDALEAEEIITSLESSAEIYRTQQTAPFESNRTRAQLMKRNFMARYGELAAQSKQPRMLFKMGANHAGRGISPTHQFDLGNLASELAESTGSRSYHVLVVAAGGSVNRWLPFMPDTAPKNMPYDAHAEFDSVGAGPLIDNALRGSWTLFDLSALREESEARKAGGAAFEQLIYAYDAVVVIDVAHAAHFYGD